MECEEGYKRPNLEQDYQLELNRKTRVLHTLVQYLLTSYRLIFVFDDASLTVPTAVHQIEPRQDDLYDDEVDGLVAN